VYIYIIIRKYNFGSKEKETTEPRNKTLTHQSDCIGLLIEGIILEEES